MKLIVRIQEHKYWELETEAESIASIYREMPTDLTDAKPIGHFFSVYEVMEKNDD